MEQTEKDPHLAQPQDDAQNAAQQPPTPQSDPQAAAAADDATEAGKAPREAADTDTAADTADDKASAEVSDPLAALQTQYDALKGDYLRLMADFDNFRKRTVREKQDLMKYGAEESVKKILPVVDDFERAMAALEKSDDIDAVKKGVELIYVKFKAYLDQNNVKVIPAAQGDTFDENLHDAMTMFPAPTPELKGKVVDCVTKGYTLNDKVIRYAKVVVGQ